MEITLTNILMEWSAVEFAFEPHTGNEEVQLMKSTDEQCEMLGQFRKSTCVNPYTSRSSSQVFSNYPECATVPSGCQRCDDVCSSRDGKRNKLDYRSQSSPPRSQLSPPRHQPSSPPRNHQRPSSSQVCDYQCNKKGGCTVTYVGPPRPGKGSGSCFPDDFGCLTARASTRCASPGGRGD